MFGAGVLSGLLGIASGAAKVLAMDQAMRIPFKVSTTTSNFMIGVTAAASAGVYLNCRYIDPGLFALYWSSVVARVVDPCRGDFPYARMASQRPLRPEAILCLLVPLEFAELSDFCIRKPPDMHLREYCGERPLRSAFTVASTTTTSSSART